TTVTVAGAGGYPAGGFALRAIAGADDGTRALPADHLNDGPAVSAPPRPSVALATIAATGPAAASPAVHRACPADADQPIHSLSAPAYWPASAPGCKARPVPIRSPPDARAETFAAVSATAAAPAGTVVVPAVPNQIAVRPGRCRPISATPPAARFLPPDNGRFRGHESRPVTAFCLLTPGLQHWPATKANCW